MKIIDCGEIEITGISIRTNNANEMNPETAKLAHYTNALMNMLMWTIKVVRGLTGFIMIMSSVLRVSSRCFQVLIRQPHQTLN